MPHVGMHKELEIHFFQSQACWLKWLQLNHATVDSIWLQLAKKDSGVKSVSYEEAREGAIMYGWIDGLINRWDQQHYLIKFTPRRKRSIWSKINRNIAQELIDGGRMQPSGLVQVEAARADGRWDNAYGSSSTIEVPPDLQQWLAQNPEAQARFDELSRGQRYSILFRLHQAKRPQTRAKYLEQARQQLTGQLSPPRIRKDK